MRPSRQNLYVRQKRPRCYLEETMPQDSLMIWYPRGLDVAELFLERSIHRLETGAPFLRISTMSAGFQKKGYCSNPYKRKLTFTSFKKKKHTPFNKSILKTAALMRSLD